MNLIFYCYLKYLYIINKLLKDMTNNRLESLSLDEVLQNYNHSNFKSNDPLPLSLAFKTSSAFETLTLRNSELKRRKKTSKCVNIFMKDFSQAVQSYLCYKSIDHSLF